MHTVTDRGHSSVLLYLSLMTCSSLNGLMIWWRWNGCCDFFSFFPFAKNCIKHINNLPGDAVDVDLLKFKSDGMLQYMYKLVNLWLEF